MDASSIITQVSRDDELGQCNKGKGRCSGFTRTSYVPLFQMLDRFCTICTCYGTSPIPLALPRLTWITNLIPLIPRSCSDSFSSEVRVRRVSSCLASPHTPLPFFLPFLFLVVTLLCFSLLLVYLL